MAYSVGQNGSSQPGSWVQNGDDVADDGTAREGAGNFPDPIQAFYMGIFVGSLEQSYSTTIITNDEGYTNKLEVSFRGPDGVGLIASITVDNIQKGPLF